MWLAGGQDQGTCSYLGWCCCTRRSMGESSRTLRVYWRIQGENSLLWYRVRKCPLCATAKGRYQGRPMSQGTTMAMYVGVGRR